MDLTLGFCPIGKFVFSHEDAMRYKARIAQRLQADQIRYLDIDAVVADGMIRNQADAEKAVEYFRSQRIDGLFTPHCNFGTEGAVGILGRKLGVPLLLWGPRDEAPLPDGSRYRDTLCGLFASSKVLHKLGVPFTYVENCRLEDPAFGAGLDLFVRTMNVVARMKNLRIGILGNRIDFFWSTIVNENELLERFGVELQPFDLVKIVGLTRDYAKKNRKRYLAERAELGATLNLDMITDDALANLLGLRDVMLDLAAQWNLRAFAVESFMALPRELGVTIGYAMAALYEHGIPVMHETDIHGAISSVMLEAAGLNREPSFLADLTVRHPTHENGLLLWHDAWPLSLRDPEQPASLGTHWIMPDVEPGLTHWKIREGELTISRFDGDHGRYSVTAATARSIPGPFTQNNYLWVELANWKAFERHFIEGPYMHHAACAYGDHVAVLRECCKYIPHLEFDPVGSRG